MRKNKTVELLFIVLLGLSVISVAITPARAQVAAMVPPAGTTDTVIATINVGHIPAGVAYDPVNHDVYVVNSNGGGTGTISVIDTSTNTVIATICGTPVCPSPSGTIGEFLGPVAVAFDPTNNNIYLTGTTRTSIGSASISVTVISGSTNTVVTTIFGIGTPCCAYNVGDVTDVAYDPANGNMYVTNGCCYAGAPPPTVSVINSATNTVSATISVAGPPTGMAYDPANHDMYVALETGSCSPGGPCTPGSVAVIDSSSNTVIATVNGIGDTGHGGPGNIAFDPANNNMYVSSGGGFIAQIISSSTNTLLATINTAGADSGPASGMAYNSANQLMYLTNSGGAGSYFQQDTVQAIDSFTNNIVSTITVGSAPRGIAYASSNNDLYVANQGGAGAPQNTVSVISTVPKAMIHASGFFTDSNLNLLPLNSNGDPDLNVTLAGGAVRSTNPGQVLAWVNLTNTSGSSVQSLELNETLPVDWTVHPAWKPAVGAIHVFYANATSLAAETNITQPSTITVSTGNPEIVHLAIANLTVTAIGHPLMPGQSILISVKLTYGLIGTTQPASSYPRTYTDTATGAAWTQTAFTGSKFTGTGSAFFKANVKVVS